MEKTDFFVREKRTGKTHRVGDDPNDAIWVDNNGLLHYRNLKTGEGCWSNSRLTEKMAYEFLPSRYGEIGAKG